MIPGNFEYHAAASLEEAVKLLGQYGDGAKILAGGQSLLPMMKLRLAEPAHLIDTSRIAALSGISEQGGTIRIGAMTTQNELIASALLRDKCPLIVETARQIADPLVRNRATIGGNLVHGDPGDDHPAVMIALGASYVLRGPKGERVAPANGFYAGPFETRIGAGEILTEVRVPAPPPGSGGAYFKLKRKIGDYAAAAAAVQLTLANGACARIGIALTNVGPTPIEVKAAQDLLRNKRIDNALVQSAARLAMEACDPAEDLKGSVEYKRHLTGVLTGRALSEALRRAGGN